MGPWREGSGAAAAVRRLRPLGPACGVQPISAGASADSLLPPKAQNSACDGHFQTSATKQPLKRRREKKPPPPPSPRRSSPTLGGVH